MKNPKFQIFKSAVNGQYYFHLVAANGEKILSGEGYTSKQACIKGIASVRVHGPAIVNYHRHNGYFNYGFNLVALNGEIVGRSESYLTANGRDDGISAVLRCVKDAVVED